MASDAPDASEQSISLLGSAELITEFFSYGVNSLLFHRGIYSPDSFSSMVKYGLAMTICTDPGVERYMKSVLSQMNKWLELKELKRVVVVFASVASREVLERWSFDVSLLGEDAKLDDDTNDEQKAASDKKILEEMKGVVRQIAGSASFLPLLEEACSFDMLIYTNSDTVIPAEWNESGPRLIADKEEVQLRSFNTSAGNVDASVTFARTD